MDGLQSALSSLPTAAVYVLGAALAVAMGGAGVAAAQSLVTGSLRTAASAASGAAGAALAALLTVRLVERRRSAAIVELANALVSMADPSVLTREAVAAIEAKYGTQLVDSCPDELKAIYGNYVEACIPLGEAPLRGDEHESISRFRTALGLADVDAAPVHIDVGRRILRGRLESGSRGEDIEARKTFQKLIYVSNLAFGDRQAAFLLPWQRVFGLSDAQLFVAKRDNARNLFKAAIDRAGGLPADRAALLALREYQQQVRLVDEEAQQVVRDAARSRVEGYLDRALACTKRRTKARDYSDAVSELRSAVDYNRALAALKGDTELPPGLGAASVAGSEWEAVEGRSRDVRELFRVYLEEALVSSGQFSPALEADLADLRLMMGLGPKEAERVEAEIKEKTYRRLLREAFTSGRLEAAPSKAELLGELCDQVGFDADAAAALHSSLFRQKLATLLEKKKLTDEDDAELSKLQRLLCIQPEERAQVHKEMAGALFRQVINAVLAVGADAFGPEDRREVAQAFTDLRMDRTAAKELLAEAGRKRLMTFITASRLKSNRLEAAKELKNMVFFSNIVLAPLVGDLKSEEERKAEVAQAEVMQLMQEAMAKSKAEEDAKKARQAAGEPEPEEPAEGAEVPQQAEPAASAAEVEAAPSTTGEEPATPASLEKAKAAADKRAAGEAVEGTGVVMKAQKDINLGKDLDLRDRQDIYRNFLMYCMTGDVVQGPMGVQLVTQRDEADFARLAQLGDVLGLGQGELMTVHQDLSEQAFTNQVQLMMGDGMLTPARAAALDSLRGQMGLSKEAADKIIKGFQNRKLINEMQAAKAAGVLSLGKVLELRDAGVDVAGLMNEDGRQQLYRDEIIARLTDGTGTFDAERLLQQLPAELAIDAAKARRVAESLAAERKRTTLVQAIAYMRQRKLADTAKAMNNLLACEAAVPSGTAAVWDQADELQDLFSIYASKESNDAKRRGVQQLLGLSDSDAESLLSIVDGGQFKMGGEVEEEESAFF